jgi:hypothetical protein
MMITPLEVFCCYAREDQEMLVKLKKHLAPLVRQGKITIWSDVDLSAGIEWEKELHHHLESADIILLLISPDFMASDYCYSTEMERALVRHNQGSARVIPVLLRAALWKSAPFAKLQIVPTDARHVASWSDRDDAFHDITTHIDQVVAELQKRSAQIPVKRDNRHQQIKQQERHYWAFRANPHIYNIDEVLNDRKIEIEYWRNPHNSNVQAGDRVLIWRKSIHGQPGGIVALGDVLEDSRILDDINKEYWLEPQKGDEKIQRVKFRYVRHEAFPLLENRADLSVLKTLKPAIAQMGGVFHVSPEEWDAIMKIIGGWPGSAPK